MKSDAHKLNEHGFVKLRSLCILEGRLSQVLHVDSLHSRNSWSWENLPNLQLEIKARIYFFSRF